MTCRVRIMDQVGKEVGRRDIGLVADRHHVSEAQAQSSELRIVVGGGRRVRDGAELLRPVDSGKPALTPLAPSLESEPGPSQTATPQVHVTDSR
jgi:hypothetical protein